MIADELSLTYTYKTSDLLLPMTFFTSPKRALDPIGDSVEARVFGVTDLEYGIVGPTAENTTNSMLVRHNLRRMPSKRAIVIIRIITSIRYRDEFGDAWEFVQNMQVDRNSFVSGLTIRTPAAPDG